MSAISYKEHLVSGEIGKGVEALEGARKLNEGIENFYAFAEARAKPLTEIDGENFEDDDLSYKPIPPKIAFKIKVRYKYIGKMKPLPYEWEDLEGDDEFLD
jgi:hypothetical protein